MTDLGFLPRGTVEGLQKSASPVDLGVAGAAWRIKPDMAFTLSDGSRRNTSGRGRDVAYSAHDDGELLRIPVNVDTENIRACDEALRR
jgi:hypothetical protein